MSLDRSLKIKSALTRHRNVLTRAERLALLKEEELWSDKDSVFSLPKVAHRKSHVGRKKAEQTQEAQAAESPQPGTTESKEQAKP